MKKKLHGLMAPKKKKKGTKVNSKKINRRNIDNYDDTYEEADYYDEYADDEYFEDEYDEAYDETEAYEDENVEGYDEIETYEDVNDEGYAETGVYEDEYYADEYDEDYDGESEYYEEEYDDDAYYSEEEGEYEEDTYCTSDEYAEEDNYYASDEYPEEDEDAFDVGYEFGANARKRDASRMKRKKSGFEDFAVMIKEHLRNMQAFDYVLTAMTIVVFIVLILAGKQLANYSKMESKIDSIVPVGTQLSQIGIVGESGLLAMADAQSNAAAVEEQITEVETETPEETDYENIKINVSFESVEKDLKIRFRNASTGDYIKGVVFEVTLTGPSGNSIVVKDDDKDGIIYVNKLKAGTFTAVIASTDKFQFPSSGQKVTVKDKVEYVVINVEDEVKKESQVNAAVEDTAKVEAKEEEVVLKDTVEWVESSKQLIGGNTSTYQKIDKNTIADPSLSTSAKAAAHKFDKLEVSLDSAVLTLQIGGTATIKTVNSFTDVTDGNTTKSYDITWSSSDANIVSVDKGVVSAKKPGTATITCKVVETIKSKVEKQGEPTKKETEKVIAEISEETFFEEHKDPEEAKEWEKRTKEDGTVVYVKTEKIEEEIPGEVTYEEQTTTNEGSATCSVTVEAAKITGATFEIAKNLESCPVGSTLTVCPAKLTYTKTDGTKEEITSGFPVVTWSSSDTNVAKVDDKGVVTGVKKGQATITGKIAGIKDKDGKELDIKASTTISIIEAAALQISLDSTSRQVMVNNQTTLVATVTNYKSDKGVTWASSDTKLATVDDKGVVKMLKAGKVKITATTKEKDVTTGKQVSATCEINIVTKTMTDYTSKLKDKNGNQVFIKDKDGKYVEAVFADYYTAGEFFISQGGQYAYTGWQTINGKTYYYDKNGKPVTGTQIIKGVTYNFGADGAIQTSVNGSTFGIDVSKWNGKIDWAAVKASGVDFAIIRCGYRGSSSGALIEDPLFRQNIQGAKAAGIKVGVYFFSQAINEVEAVKEASFAVELAKGYGLTYPIFIDTEPSGGRADGLDKATRTMVVNAFCNTVQAAGHKAGIYASKSWFEQKLQASSLSQYKIWLAQYSAKPTYGGRYDMWQYSHKGTISGIKGNVDLNYSYLGY